MLKQEKRVSNIMAIINAFVPILSMTIDGISVDIPVLVGREMYSIPNNYNYTNLSFLDPYSPYPIRSIQGALNTHALRTQIPNMPVFCETLSILKCFCKVSHNISNYV